MSTLGVERVADAAEAHVDHARALVDRPADRLHLGLDRDRAVGRHDLRHEQLGRRRQAGDADAVVRLRGDQPGDEGSVALLVDGRRAADEALRLEDPAGQIGVAAVDARVDHRHERRRERRLGVPGVVRPVLRQVPLPRGERVVRHVRGSRRALSRSTYAAPGRPRSACAAGASTSTAPQRARLSPRPSPRCGARPQRVLVRAGRRPTAKRAAPAEDGAANASERGDEERARRISRAGAPGRARRRSRGRGHSHTVRARARAGRRRGTCRPRLTCSRASSLQVVPSCCSSRTTASGQRGVTVPAPPSKVTFGATAARSTGPARAAVASR